MSDRRRDREMEVEVGGGSDDNLSDWLGRGGEWELELEKE